MDDLMAKTVLITGASTGIGAGCARAFGSLGARVAVHTTTARRTRRCRWRGTLSRQARQVRLGRITRPRVLFQSAEWSNRTD